MGLKNFFDRLLLFEYMHGWRQTTEVFSSNKIQNYKTYDKAWNRHITLNNIHQVLGMNGKPYMCVDYNTDTMYDVYTAVYNTYHEKTDIVRGNARFIYFEIPAGTPLSVEENKELFEMIATEAFSKEKNHRKKTFGT